MRSVSQPTVLVVDDEEAIAEAVRARLQSEGYEVLVAGDGPEAIRVCDEAPPGPHSPSPLLPGWGWAGGWRRAGFGRPGGAASGRPPSGGPRPPSRSNATGSRSTRTGTA